MNGSIIVSQSREQLADELYSYRDSPPIPLSVSPWIAMSLLQKAIRRGEVEIALSAAASLLLSSPDRLWRRIGAAAFEEIGVADLDTVSLVTSALAGKRFRSSIGGDWKVASFAVERMAKSLKCRSADDLLLTAELHPRFARARTALATKSIGELVKISTGSAALPVRALAAWFACGTHPRQTKLLSLRRGEPTVAFDQMCEAGLPHTVVEIAREGYRTLGLPLCPFLALLSPHALLEDSSSCDDVFPESSTIGPVPSWCLDMYTREGRAALSRFLGLNCETARWVRDHLRPPHRVNFVGTVLFRVEGGLVRHRAQWSLAEELRRRVDIECHAPPCNDGTELLGWMRNDIRALNEERSNVG